MISFTPKFQARKLEEGISLAWCNKRNLRHSKVKEQWFGCLWDLRHCVWRSSTLQWTIIKGRNIIIWTETNKSCPCFWAAFWYIIKVCCRTAKCSSRASCLSQTTQLLLMDLHLLKHKMNREALVNLYRYGLDIFLTQNSFIHSLASLELQNKFSWCLLTEELLWTRSLQPFCLSCWSLAEILVKLCINHATPKLLLRSLRGLSRKSPCLFLHKAAIHVTDLQGLIHKAHPSDLPALILSNFFPNQFLGSKSV